MNFKLGVCGLKTSFGPIGPKRLTMKQGNSSILKVFERRYSESKTDQSYPIKWGNFDCTWDNFDWLIKVTPSLNKVTMIIVNK